VYFFFCVKIEVEVYQNRKRNLFLSDPLDWDFEMMRRRFTVTFPLSVL